jgi:SAM-dependent methyltransferase
MSIPSSESRKLEEAEFHDRVRGIYEKDPERYAYYRSNKKYYSVAGSSRAFFFDWLRENAAGKRVLDFGSGNGLHTLDIARLGAAQVTGIDISPDSVEIANQHAKEDGLSDKVKFIVGDGENLDFPPGSFDVVCVSGVLHHMDLELALGQIRKVLTPDGKGIFLEALANNPIIHAYRKRTPHLRTAWEAEHILRYEDTKRMRKFFKNVEVRTFHLAVLAAVPLRDTVAFKPVHAVLDKVDSALLRIPGLRTQGWMGIFVVSNPA